MYEGKGNPNASVPLEKMKIVNLDTSKQDQKEITVLFNPQSYWCKRDIKYKGNSVVGKNDPIIQYRGGEEERLGFELFFDSLSAGSEVGGADSDRKKFGSNSTRSSSENSIDVRDYTQKVASLMNIEESVHRPPKVRVEWASLQFTGFLSSCEQNFVKFDESGRPVRATMKCTFVKFVDPEGDTLKPLESPDTTKFRTVRQGDSLWAMAAQEYGGPDQWREIAAANGIVNPRRLRSGDRLVLPALD